MDFLFIGSAMAQGQTAAAQPSTLEMLIMPLGFLLIFYFFIIRPQSKKHKDQQALLSSLKPGDEVITSGGIIGRVKSVADTFVTIDTGGSSLKVVKEHISANTKSVASPAPSK